MQPIAGNPHPLNLQDQLGKADYVLYYLFMDLMPVNHDHIPATFAETLANGLANISVEIHIDRRAHETRVSESTRRKIFLEKYGDRIDDGILLLTASSGDDVLPTFYQELGGNQNGESDRDILQREVD
jgi:hypothetical protein